MLMTLNNILKWLFHVGFISLTKSVYNGLKATLHEYFIQKDMSMNINKGIGCLFLNFVGHTCITLQAMQKTARHSICQHPRPLEC